MTCRIRLDKGGYIPGEKVHIWASVSNRSRVGIRGTEALLTEVHNQLAFHVFTPAPRVIFGIV